MFRKKRICNPVDSPVSKREMKSYQVLNFLAKNESMYLTTTNQPLANYSFFQNASLCIEEMHTAYFFFIPQRLARGLTAIIQAEAVQKGVKAPPNEYKR
jgi:hypothetical protein